MAEGVHLNNRTLIILSPAFPGDESGEQSPWLPAQQSLVRSINRNFPVLEVIILVFQFPVKKTEYYWHGNRVIPFGGANKKGWANLALWLKVFMTLRGLWKQKNLLGIISFWCGECCLVGSYFSRLYSIKHLCWICGQDARMENKFVKRARPKAGELAAMSDFLMDEFEKNHSIRPAYLIPDAIDTTLFTGTQPQRTIDILGAGNLVPLKRYDIFIGAVAAIANKYPGLKAVLCGSGTEEQNLKVQANQAGLQNIAAFTGLLPHIEVLEYMKKAKVFLHTSSYEGFGNVCIEALYAGAHVISFTRPMKADIPHWHIVSTQEEMVAKALAILHDAHTAYTTVLPFNMDDSAKMFIQVFTGNGDAV